MAESIACGPQYEVLGARSYDGDEVVLKRPVVSASGEQILAMDNERRCLARCRHERVVRLIDHGEHSGRAFVVLERVYGGDLVRMVDLHSTHRERIPVPIVAQIMLDLLTALESVHGANTVHRDVCPMNVLLSQEGRVKLIDFGIASAPGQSQSDGGALSGRLPYMAPEALRGASTDFQSDLWAAGVVFWELLAGRALFYDPDRRRLLSLILSEPIGRIRHYRPETPKQLVRVVEALLQRDQSRRCDSASQARDMLGDAISTLQFETGGALVAARMARMDSASSRRIRRQPSIPSRPSRPPRGPSRTRSRGLASKFFSLLAGGL